MFPNARLAGLLAVGILGTRPLTAQTLSASVSRWLASPHVTEYTGSINEWGIGPIGIKPQVVFLAVGSEPEPARLLGAGATGRVGVDPGRRFFLTGAATLGLIDFRSTLGVDPWFQWSLGAAYELWRTTGIGVQLEARYARLNGPSPGTSVDGLALGIRIGNPFGRNRAAATPRRNDTPIPIAPPAADTSQSIALATVARAGAPSSGSRAFDVVQAAQSVMGTPYRWGGTDANGFDCSGLISYSYAQIGIPLPRRSREQAEAGRPVDRAIDALQAGDILTFAATPGGGDVSHVGLYLGDGRFIHSSSNGVRISGLDQADQEGKWWVPRWVGVRRLLP